MNAYLAQRLAMVPIVVFMVATLVFVLVRTLPGDIVDVLTAEAPRYGAGDELRAKLGLDKPMLEQYVEFLKDSAQGNFGTSLYFEKPVSEQINQALPVTVELATLAILISLLASVPLGVLGAVKPDSKVDYAARLFSVLFHGVPIFWIATLVLTFLAIWFKWIPPLGYRPIWVDPLGNIQQFIIPAVLVALGSMGLKMRVVRAQMLDVLSQDYIRTARAKGLASRAVIWRHGVRNALIPVVAIVGNQMGALLGGTAIIETVFNLPGLGRMLITAVDNRDYPSITGAVLVTSCLLVVVNLVTDLIYAWLNPRIKLG